MYCIILKGKRVMIKEAHIHEDKEKISLEEGKMEQGCTEGEMRWKPASINKREK